LSEEKEREEIQCAGSFLKNEGWMFEQTEDGYIFWDKKLNQKLESPPKHDYVPLSECPWKLARTLESYGNKETLWNEIKTFLIHHIFLPDERLYDVLTAWVLASWVPEKWGVIPYLLIKGPMSCGKTRLLETLEAITYRGIFSANMTSAALFRVLELHRPTIFLDETEIYNKDEYSDVTHLLNAGYRRGQKAWRVERDRDGLPYVKGYDVFGFKALAGTEELAKTLHSRSIVIDMVKNIQRVNFSVNEQVAQALRNRLLQWRFNELSTFCEDVKQSEGSEGTYPPPILELSKSCPDGRLLELFHCILSVANNGTENILSYAKSMHETRESEEQASVQCQILEAMLQCEQDLEGGILTKTITDKLNKGVDEKDKFKTRYVGKILNGLGFQRLHTRVGNGFKWDKRMIEYRVLQYHLQGYAPPQGSLSFTPSPNGKLMEFPREDKVLVNIESSQTPYFTSCYFCQKPIYTDDAVSNDFTAHKPAHKECWELQQGMTKKKEETFNPNLNHAKDLGE
jgi:hypothetical protein